MLVAPEQTLLSKRKGVAAPKESLSTWFGLQCQEVLQWRHWHPGGEYIKMIVVKNVQTKAIKFKYQVPSSKLFSMDYPEFMKLSPGMSVQLRVVFRPLKMQEYQDTIYLVLEDGRTVPVKLLATLPFTQLTVPQSLDFGCVPTMEEAELPFEIRNVGDNKVSFQWIVGGPFRIEPPQGQLMVGHSLQMKAFFKPTDAAAVTVHAGCQVEGGETQVMHVSGIGKFPYLSLEFQSVDFGNVLVGQSEQRSIRFGNHSMVQANFTITHSGSAHDGVFSVSPARGILPPEKFSELLVTYTPKHTGTFSCEEWVLSTPGGNQVTLTLRGLATSPVVTFSSRSFNFGSVAIGQTASRVLYLHNQSAMPASFQFRAELMDLFSFSKVRGTIPPETTTHITITFRPHTPFNFWRRVVCLIKDASPVGLDLVGTSFDEKTRPPPLTQQHINTYMSRVMSALRSAPGHPASDCINSEPGTSILAHGASNPHTPATPAQNMVGPDAWDLYFNGIDPMHAVVVDTDLLEFGTCSRLSSPEYKQVVVTNNTDVKLLAFVSVPAWQDPAGQDLPQPVFQVIPEQQEIKPQSQAIFRVAFRPTRDAQFYCQTLHVSASMKMMRNFRLVSEDQIVPPWTVPITASGDTFLHNNPEFSPKAQLQQTSISFPPCKPGEHVQQTLLLLNYGDTSVHFSFNAGTSQEFFAIKPKLGVIPAKSHQVVGVQFHPTDTKPVLTRATVVFNNMAMNAAEVVLRGAAYLPKLSFDGGASSLYFRPTCVGASSQRAFTLKNPSRIPVAFMFTLPQELHGVVDVTPTGGRLRGNESCQTLWTFSPSKQQKYEHRVTCTVESAEDKLCGNDSRSSSDKQELPLLVVGEGTLGAVAIEPPALDLGHVKVGYAIKRTVKLLNRSDGLLRYTIECSMGDPDDLHVDPVTFLASGLTEELVPTDQEFWVDEPEGTLAAKASKTVTITVFPRYRKHYNLQLHVRSATINQLTTPQLSHEPSALFRSSSALITAPLGAINRLEVDSKVTGPRPTIATVDVVAEFPAVRVTDVQCLHMPKHVLWQMLGIEQLNEEFMSVVTSTELQLNQLDDKGELTNDIACHTLRPYTFNIGMLAHGSKPRTIHVELSNTSKMSVHWELHSYDNPEMEMENWVRPGAPATEDERLRAFIVENRILDVKPRSGMLESGGCVIVSFTYTPGSVGEHHLPIFFHAQDGKRIYMDLCGITVPPEHPHLSILTMDHTFVFEPVALGDTQPPLQMYTLRNFSPGNLTYVLDLSMLSRLQEESYGFPVLQCCSSVIGEIPVGGVATINFLFHPIEARVYQTQIGIRLGHGQDEVVTLIGRGFNPHEEGSSQHMPIELNPHWESWHSFSLCPRIGLAGQLATISQDMLLLEPTLIKGVSKTLLVLKNLRPFGVLFNWDLGVFGWISAAVEGSLSIQPSAGRIEAHAVIVCQLAFEAGLKPQLFSGELTCTIEADTFDPLWQAPLAEDDTDQQDQRQPEEQLIAQDPAPPQKVHKRGSLLKNRLPVHLSSTVAIRNRLDPIKDRHSNIEASIAWAKIEGRRGPIPPAPQTITVTVAGRVLTTQQLRAGYFTMPWAQEETHNLAKGAAWVPQVIQPFWEKITQEEKRPASSPAPLGKRGKGVAFKMDDGYEAEAAPDQGLDVANEALKDILADVLNDTDVIHAFDYLEEEGIPVLAEIHPQLPQIFLMRSLEACHSQHHAEVLSIEGPDSKIAADIDINWYLNSDQSAHHLEAAETAPAETLATSLDDLTQRVDSSTNPVAMPADRTSVSNMANSVSSTDSPAGSLPEATTFGNHHVDPIDESEDPAHQSHGDPNDSSNEEHHEPSPAHHENSQENSIAHDSPPVEASSTESNHPLSTKTTQHSNSQVPDTNPSDAHRVSGTQLTEHSNADPAVDASNQDSASPAQEPNATDEQPHVAASDETSDPSSTFVPPDNSPADTATRESVRSMQAVDLSQDANTSSDAAQGIEPTDVDHPVSVDQAIVAETDYPHHDIEVGMSDIDGYVAGDVEGGSERPLDGGKSSLSMLSGSSIREDIDISSLCLRGEVPVDKLKRLLSKRSELQNTLRHPGYLLFAEFVMDKTLMSLMQESVMGDWEL